METIDTLKRLKSLAKGEPCYSECNSCPIHKQCCEYKNDILVTVADFINFRKYIAKVEIWKRLK
jgi:hypothetical protein